MPYCDMQQENAQNRCPENTWETLGRMVQSMALDAVALQFSQMHQAAAKRPSDHDHRHGIDGNPEVIR